MGRSRWLCIPLTLASLACGSQGTRASNEEGGSANAAGSSQSDPSDGSEQGGTSSAQGQALQMQVVAAEYQYAIAAFQARPGHRFVVLDLTLSNTDIEPALSTAPTHFTLRTRDSLVVSPTAASAVLDASCRADVAVASGGQASCELAFELAAGQEPEELVYDDGHSHSCSASIPSASAPATACDQASKRSFESASCSECFGQACVDELLEFDRVQSECDANFTCARACADCGCAYACLTRSVCLDSYDSLWGCAANACKPQCP